VDLHGEADRRPAARLRSGLLRGRAEYYKGDPNSGYRSYVFTDHLTADRLVELRNWVERDVRRELDIPFNPSAAAVCYEHSMGRGINALPAFVLRRSSPLPAGSGNADRNAAAACLTPAAAGGDAPHARGAWPRQ